MILVEEVLLFSVIVIKKAYLGAYIEIMKKLVLLNFVRLNK